MTEDYDKQLETLNKPEHRRVTIQDAASVIDQAIVEGKYDYAVLAENKVVVVEYILPSGFTISGRSAMIDPTGFNLEEALRRCRDIAVKNLQAYLAFHIEQQRFEENLKR